MAGARPLSFARPRFTRLMSELTDSPAWRALQAQAARLRVRRIAELFADDAQRATRFAAQGAGLYLDYSKQRLDAAAFAGLLELARQQDLGGWIARMFAGERINATEDRAALHVALRAPRTARIAVDGRDVMPAVHAELDRVCSFAEQVRDGRVRGLGEAPFTDVLSLGIGGSDAGPRLVCDALAHQADGPRVHFVANVDPAPLGRLLRNLDPARTLVVVISKTFTTQETMTNARAARAWLVARLGEAAVARHCAAVSTHLAEVRRFGIGEERIFGFWDWVGGRYSLWSAVGLPIALALGAARFRELLAGAHAMDEHFRCAPFSDNLPAILGLLGVWNNNFLGLASQVVIPYAQNLERLLPWLQQLEMESNGKRVNRDGHAVDYATTPALWGDVGTNAQHAFFQMLHQGPAVHALDFILPLAPSDPALAAQHRLLVAHGLAQSAALMRGKSEEEVRAELRSRGIEGAALEAALPHRVFPGDRPSNTLLLPRLDAFHLGALLRSEEHTSELQSVIWNLNAFDQWGVELGKQLAGKVLEALEGRGTPPDPSTANLIERVRDAQAR